MNKLVKSDIRRILKKSILYIFLVILWGFAIFTKNGRTPGQQIDAMQRLIDTFGIILISMPVLLCVYGDEFKAGSMQIAIGRGVSRTKIIFAKFLDCVILSLMLAILLAIVIYIKNLATGLAISDKQNLMLMVYILFAVIKACGYYAIAAFFMMMNYSIASGMIIDLFMLLFFDKILKILSSKLKIGLYDITLSGMMDDAYQALVGGDFPSMLVPALILIIVVVVATAVMFRRKELEL